MKKLLMPSELIIGWPEHWSASSRLASKRNRCSKANVDLLGKLFSINTERQHPDGSAVFRLKQLRLTPMAPRFTATNFKETPGEVTE
jgi:hypothetical protein